MRIFKIFLTLISIFVLLAFIFFGIMMFNNKSGVALYGFVHLFLGFLASALSVIFHLKSYRYYRKNKKVDYSIKISKWIWLGAISFIASMTYITILFVVSHVQKASLNLKINAFITVLFIVIGLSIAEIVLLEKRVKKGTIAQEQLHEIDEIGL